MSPLLTWHLLAMDFGKRLAALRKERAMTQQALADQVGCHVTMIRRYEANETQPTLEVIRKLVRALSVSADALVFEVGERDPEDDLKLRFEALAALPAEAQEVAKAVLDAMIVKNQVTGTLERMAKPATRSKKAAAR